MHSRRQTVDRTVCANAKKPIDINKQGLNSIKNKVVQKNLMGVSESVTKKGWKDSQGRSGKVCECSIHQTMEACWLPADRRSHESRYSVSCALP